MNQNLDMDLPKYKYHIEEFIDQQGLSRFYPKVAMMYTNGKILPEHFWNNLEGNPFFLTLKGAQSAIDEHAAAIRASRKIPIIHLYEPRS
jgi:hypothetical protein